MILNVTRFGTAAITRIADEVGKPYSFFRRILLGVGGSTRLRINSASSEILKRIGAQGEANCFVEIRPRGVVVEFRSAEAKYAVAIPFYRLSLFKGGPNEYSLYFEHHFIKVQADRMETHDFFKKLLAIQATESPAALEDR